VGSNADYSFSTAGLSDGIYIVKLSTTENSDIGQKIIIKTNLLSGEIECDCYRLHFNYIKFYLCEKIIGLNQKLIIKFPNAISVSYQT
jgi:hypothetical protein